MTDAPIPIKAIAPVFFPTGTATGRLRDGVPEIVHGVGEIPVRGIFCAPPAEARRLIDKRRAVPFEPGAGSKLAELLPAVSNRHSRAEAAEIGGSMKGVNVWRAVRGPDGHWRPASGETGGFGPATDAAFPNAKAIRRHWANHPKATPLFVLHEREGVRAFAWINGALVEALRD